MQPTKPRLFGILCNVGTVITRRAFPPGWRCTDPLATHTSWAGWIAWGIEGYYCGGVCYGMEVGGIELMQVDFVNIGVKPSLLSDEPSDTLGELRAVYVFTKVGKAARIASN